jgi:hypothetical protein
MMTFLQRQRKMKLVYSLKKKRFIRQSKVAMESDFSLLPFFLNRVLHLCLGWPGLRSSYLCFCVAGMIGMQHHAQLFID